MSWKETHHHHPKKWRSRNGSNGLGGAGRMTVCPPALTCLRLPIKKRHYNDNVWKYAQQIGYPGEKSNSTGHYMKISAGRQVKKKTFIDYRHKSELPTGEELQHDHILAVIPIFFSWHGCLELPRSHYINIGA